MTKYEKKFVVINRKYIEELPPQLKDEFTQALSEINEYLPKNEYLVCNRDETYANDILAIILIGEKVKEAKARLAKMEEEELNSEPQNKPTTKDYKGALDLYDEYCEVSNPEDGLSFVGWLEEQALTDWQEERCIEAVKKELYEGEPNRVYSREEVLNIIKKHFAQS